MSIWLLIEGGKIKPMAAVPFSLEDAFESHRPMEGGKPIGKIIAAVARKIALTNNLH